MEYITLTISAQTLQAIGLGLNELPYKVARPALDEIDAQVQTYLGAKRGTTNSSGASTDDSGNNV